jgi:hypothetical protein
MNFEELFATSAIRGRVRGLWRTLALRTVVQGERMTL